MLSSSSGLSGNTRHVPLSTFFSAPSYPRLQALVQRYNPLTSLTEQERIRKTANRVGLDVPEGPADLE